MPAAPEKVRLDSPIPFEIVVRLPRRLGWMSGFGLRCTPRLGTAKQYISTSRYTEPSVVADAGVQHTQPPRSQPCGHPTPLSFGA